ncbi:MAG TPA: hypothetical protein VJU59_51230 [Paraburkholderia sp.]|uniref:hypothetical protein n=1 Tax=Paraburkholderia sp. TaxID=1926495 RepID=UPI002B4820E1|nr:hypothetical protein [Paraburkholderia sp.]HKR47956.1 hypothetical protein [Paraburkholderia sp.]
MRGVLIAGCRSTHDNAIVWNVEARLDKQRIRGERRAAPLVTIALRDCALYQRRRARKKSSMVEGETRSGKKGAAVMARAQPRFERQGVRSAQSDRVLVSLSSW